MNIVEMLRELLYLSPTIGDTTMPFSIFEFIFTFALPLIILFAVYRLILYLIKRLLNKSKLETETKEKIQKGIKLFLRLVYLVIFFSLAGRLFGARMFTYINSIYSIISEPFFESGSTRISIITLVLAIPVFYFASWISRVTRSFIDNNLLGRIALDESRKFSISNLLRYLIMALAILVGLSIIGINLSSLAVIFGVLGIGVGFGLQSVVENFFAGLIIIISRPIKEGDRILASGFDGTVIHIRLINTIINTLTNETLIIPNSKLINNSVHNYSYQERKIIILNSVQVSYKADLDKALEVITEVGFKNPYALTDPAPEARVDSFDDSGITLSLWTWIKDVTFKLKAHSWANLEIWREFKKEEVEIPFPQVDVHMKKD